MRRLGRLAPRKESGGDRRFRPGDSRVSTARVPVITRSPCGRGRSRSGPRLAECGTFTRPTSRCRGSVTLRSANLARRQGIAPCRPVLETRPSSRTSATYGCRRRSRTAGLVVMSHASCRCSILQQSGWPGRYRAAVDRLSADCSAFELRASESGPRGWTRRFDKLKALSGVEGHHRRPAGRPVYSGVHLLLFASPPRGTRSAHPSQGSGLRHLRAPRFVCHARISIWKVETGGSRTRGLLIAKETLF